MRRLTLVLLVALAVLPTAEGATNPVVAAAKRTAAVKSSTLRMSVSSVFRNGVSTTLAGTGAQRGTSVKLSMQTRGQAAAFQLDAVLLDERGSYVMYMRSPAFDAQLPSGTSWLRLDLSRQAATIGIDFSSLVSTSQSFAPLEKGLVSTKRLGRETVAGSSTTHYRAVIDVQRAGRAVPSYGKQVAAIQKATGIRLGRSPYDVWVAGDGRIRQMRFSTPTATNGVRGTTTQTITFLSFDTPVSITAPPRSQVFTP